MKYTSKSIKTVFTAHQAELFALMQSPKDFGKLQTKVNDLLNSKELEGNQSVPEEAEKIQSAARKGYNVYVSTLLTMMTGMKVS